MTACDVKRVQLPLLYGYGNVAVCPKCGGRIVVTGETAPGTFNVQHVPTEPKPYEWG